MNLKTLLILWILTHVAYSNELVKQMGTLYGEVRIGINGIKLANAGPLIIFLEPLSPNANQQCSDVPARVSIKQVRQEYAQFDPDFLVVVLGQTLEFPNNDDILHNVFSYSPGNKFDLGLYPQGSSKSVKFDHPGIVRIYCSIHNNMNCTILVVPTPFYTQVNPSGKFKIKGIVPGNYHVNTWNEMLPAITRKVSIAANIPTELTLIFSENK